jgi:hypothetical protein
LIKESKMARGGKRPGAWLERGKQQARLLIVPHRKELEICPKRWQFVVTGIMRVSERYLWQQLLHQLYHVASAFRQTRSRPCATLVGTVAETNSIKD